MIRNLFGRIFPFFGTGNTTEDMQKSDDWEQLQQPEEEIPAHEFLDTDRNQSAGEIQSHAFLDTSDFLEVSSEADVSMEIKAHPLLTESGEHVLVTPTYSPGSGSSVDPADKYPLNQKDGVDPTTPVRPDGSGDRASHKESPGVKGDRGEGDTLKDATSTVEVIEVKNLEAADVKSEDKTAEAAIETAEELTSEEQTIEKDENEKDLEAVKSFGEKEGSYISYVHHMTANQKLIKAKDLFYQLGFQKGVSKAEIEEAAVQQYKLAARKQVKFWIKDARYFAEILFSGPWIDENLPMLDGKSGRRNKGNKKKNQKNFNLNEQFELPGGTCRDFRLKDNPNLETVREDAGCPGAGKCRAESAGSADSLDKFVSDYTNTVIDQAIKIAISDGLSESAIMEVIDDVTLANISPTPRKGAKVTPLDPLRTPRRRPDQLAMGFNYHSNIVVKESPKTLHGEIIPIDLSKQPREKPEQFAIGFNYHSDVIVKESPKPLNGEILSEVSPATPKRRARDQLALGFNYHSQLLAKDVVVDHNENVTKTENKNQVKVKENSVTNSQQTPEKDNIETIMPKSAKKSFSDTFAVGFSYNSDLMMKESMDQVNGNLDSGIMEVEEKVMENEEINGNDIIEISDMVGEVKLAGSMW